MAVQFILGRAGTGKTEHCFDAIEAWIREQGLGGNAMLITPRQATQVAERQLVARKPGRSLLGVRVVSLEWLVREIAPQLAESLDLLDGRARRLLVALAIQEHAKELRYFVGAERQPHLAARIDAALTEIEQSGATLEAVRQGVEKAQGSSSQKLADLAIIEAAYLQLLGDRLDRHRLDARVIEAIDASPLVAQSLIVVDGFADFTPMQRRMMVSLGRRAKRMDIALLLERPDGEASDLFPRTQRTYQRLQSEMHNAGVRIEPPLVLAEVRRYASPELAAIETGFETGRPYEGAAVGAVQIVEAATDLDEVRFAAEQVRRWQIEGARLREIGIFCRDLEPYAQWVRPIFAEYGIACFIDQQRSLGEHPLMRYVRAALRIAMDGWRRPTVLELLKCGMSPLEGHEVDRLENFALRHGIDRGQWLAAWDYLKPPVGEDEEREETAERLRDEKEAELCASYRDKAVEAIQGVAQAMADERIAASSLTAALRELVDGKSVERRLRELSEGASAEEREAHGQCIKGLHELFDACDRLLAAGELPRRHAAEMLLAAMEEMSVKLAPPTLDQVLVAQVDRSRSPDFKRVIVMGMNEGTFPAKAAEDSVFSDSERQALDQAGVELNADSETRAISEQLVGYIAMTRASHAMVLTRPRTDEAGRKLAPSGFIGQVQKVLPLLKVQAAKLAINPRAAEAQLKAADYGNEPQLDPEVAQELLGDEMNCSATRLELFAQCPFRHFLERSLRLKEREVSQVSSLDLGNAFHHVLEKLAQKMIAEKLDWSSESLIAALEAMIDEVAGELRGQVILSSARNRHLREVIKGMLVKLIADQRLLAASGYRVVETELVFGEKKNGSLPALKIKTPKGRTVRLRGRIDRVDCREADGEASYVVFDYKSSARTLHLQEVEQGISLQLVIYWLVMQENGRAVDAALYQQLMRPMETTKAPETAAADEVRCKPRGLIDFAAKDRLDPLAAQWSKLYGLYVNAKGGLGNEHSSDAVQSPDLKALQDLVRRKVGELADAIFDGEVGIGPYQMGNKSPCPYCPYRAVCRFDTRYNEYRPIDPAKRSDVLDRANPARVEQKPAEGEKQSKKRGKAHA